MKKWLILSIIYSFIVFGQAQASDDVYVDLSVLDSIPQDSIGFVSSEPLFPIVKKTQPTPVAKRKARIVKKKAVAKPTKKQAPAKQPVITVKKEPVKVEPQEQEIVLSVDETNINQPEPQNLLPEVAADKTETQQEVTVTEQIPAEEKSVSEEQTVVEEKAVVEEKTVVEEKSAVEPQNNEAEPEKEVNAEATTENESVQAPQKTETMKPSELEQLLISPQNNENSVMSAKISEENNTNSEEVVLRPKEIYSLSFAPDSSELTPESIQKLDKMLHIFDADHKKKISIKAYNYDNGVESFRKKRISLNRATEVRSYFLNNGFKNFSIKIINTTVDNEYKDTVEIEELD